MRLQIRWMSRRPASGTQFRLEQFRNVLAAAWETRKYRPLLEAAGLGTKEAVAGLTCIQAGLNLLPGIALDEYRSATADFRNPAASGWKPHKLRFPLARVPRTAVLMPGFSASGRVQVFTSDWERRLRLFRPEAIAAPVAVLRALAESVRGASFALPPLEHAVIAFSRVGEDPISEADRELFWQIFQVPIFEQLLGFDGRVVARECEAHDGLHIEEDDALVEQLEGRGSELYLTSLTDLRYPALRVGTGLGFCLAHGACGCGRAGPRVAQLWGIGRKRASATCAAD